MGNIIHKFKGYDKPQVYIKRRADDHETQELHFSFASTISDAWLSTETGNSINMFCRDENGDTVEVQLPVSVEELKEAILKQIVPERIFVITHLKAGTIYNTAVRRSAEEAEKIAEKWKEDLSDDEDVDVQECEVT